MTLRTGRSGRYRYYTGAAERDRPQGRRRSDKVRLARIERLRVHDADSFSWLRCSFTIRMRELWAA